LKPPCVVEVAAFHVAAYAEEMIEEERGRGSSSEQYSARRKEAKRSARCKVERESERQKTHQRAELG
jgi:hypothetical protein